MLIQEQDWHTFRRMLIVKPEVNSSVQVELGKGYARLKKQLTSNQGQNEGKNQETK